MAQGTTTHPGTTIYTDAAGHTRELYYQQSKHDGTWFPVYSWSSCTDDCRMCISDDQEDYCGEEW